ncbi:MAG: NUDIX hydrolase [Flammeovirgaceae bacterium]
MSKQIGVKAMCLFKHQDKLLFSSHVHAQSGTNYFRPLGGSLMFQETSADAIQRELQEELGAAITNLVFVDVLENIFEYKGELRHEIIFIYKADFEDQQFYETNPIHFQEDDLAHYQTQWISLTEIRTHSLRLVPEGIEQCIQKAYRLQ